MLGRVIRYTSWGVQYEADPSHAEIALREMGMESSPVATPAAKDLAGDSESRQELAQRRVGALEEEDIAEYAAEASPPLEGDARRRY